MLLLRRLLLRRRDRVARLVVSIGRARRQHADQHPDGCDESSGPHRLILRVSRRDHFTG
jgi:hypothetical protein